MQHELTSKLESNYTNYIPLLFLALLILAAYFQVITSLIKVWWSDDNYSHGFLIPLVSGYFIHQKKEKLAQVACENCNIGLVLFIIGLTIYIIGVSAAEYFSTSLSFIIVILGLTLYLYGKSFLKEIWFPIIFLCFMIPLPYVIYYNVTFPMQLLSTRVAALILQLFGFPITQQGNIIHLQNYSLEVVEACSGLRSLITLTALAAAMGYMTQKTTFSRIFILLLAIPIAIGANVFRIILTAIAAVLISPKLADGFLHDISGLVVFLVGFLSLQIAGVSINWLKKMKDYEPVVTQHFN